MFGVVKFFAHLDNGVTEANRAEELDTLLLGGGSEAELGLVSGSLVGNEERVQVEGTGLGWCGGGSGWGHHGSAPLSTNGRCQFARATAHLDFYERTSEGDREDVFGCFCVFLIRLIR